MFNIEHGFAGAAGQQCPASNTEVKEAGPSGPYHLEWLSPFIIDTMPKQIVMVKLMVSNGSHGWISSHIGEASLFAPMLIWGYIRLLLILI
jgi:hypothetical protein